MPTTDYTKHLASLLENIEENQDLSDSNTDLLRKFARDLQTEGLSDARVHKLVTHMKRIGESIDIQLGEPDEEATREAMAWVRQQDYAAQTEKDYAVAIKRFYQWFEGMAKREHPDYVDWLNTTMQKTNEKLPEDLLDEDEVKTLIQAATNPRTRALISMLWETGARPGELYDLVIRDLRSHKWGLQAVISGKTGPRRLPLISSTPHIQDWLDKHPRGDDKDAPVWVYLQNQNQARRKKTEKGTKAGYHALVRDVERTFDRAGIDKKEINPYLFRHSRATYLANRFTEAQMCEWFGWVQGSKMPGRYVHLSGRDIDNTYGQLHGKEVETEEESEMKPQTCSRCQHTNGAEARFCKNCGAPLNEKTALEQQQKETQDKEELIQNLSPEELQSLLMAGIEAREN